MRTPQLLLLSFIVLVSACASTGKQAGDLPDWVDGQSKQHPKALYLTGVGIADNLDDAKDRARADLAKQFEVAVQEQSQQQQEYTKQQQGEESAESLRQSVTRQLITRTTRTVQGIEIANTWRDNNTHKHYVLAALSRNKAKQQYEQQIHVIDEQSKQKLRQAEDETDALRKAAQVNDAIELQLQRMSVQSALQVVDPTGYGKPGNIPLGELMRTRDALINKINIEPISHGQLADKLIPVISGNTANAGFNITESAQAKYKLLAEAKLDPPLKKQGWIWLRGTLQLTLRDPNNNEIGIKRWPLKAASVTADQSQQRLINDIDKILKSELRNTVLGFADVK